MFRKSVLHKVWRHIQRTYHSQLQVSIYSTRWWFQTSLIFTPTWGNDPMWIIFFKWVAIQSIHLYTLQYRMHSKNQKHRPWVIGCYQHGIYGTKSKVQQFLHCLGRPTATSLTWSLLGAAQRTASSIPAVVLQGGSGNFSTHCFWAKTGKIIEGHWTIWPSHVALPTNS